ncbi:MAG: hypothetical protein UZ08_BCD001001280 [Candidatus Parvibacillus calidus]|nr:MAG: hypothetical protein UZ08_BCD001001280 [Candidatus Parvibacillus calidus]
MAYQIVFSGIIDDDVTKPAYRAIVGRSVYEDFIVNLYGIELGSAIEVSTFLFIDKYFKYLTNFFAG